MKGSTLNTIHITKRAFIEFSILYISLILFLIILSVIDGTGISGMQGIDMLTMIYMFSIGFSLFSEIFHLNIANSCTRKSTLKSLLIISILTSFALVFVSFVSTALVPDASNTENLIQIIYPTRYDMFTNPFFSTKYIGDYISFMPSLYILSFEIGMLMALIFYKLNKSAKIAVFIGISASTIILLSYFNNTVTEILSTFLALESQNPYRASLNILILSAVIFTINYLLIRKLPANLK